MTTLTMVLATGRSVQRRCKGMCHSRLGSQLEFYTVPLNDIDMHTWISKFVKEQMWVCILCGASACHAQLYVNAVTCMYVKMCTRANQSIGRGVFWYNVATTYIYIRTRVQLRIDARTAFPPEVIILENNHSPSAFANLFMCQNT